MSKRTRAYRYAPTSSTTAEVQVALDISTPEIRTTMAAINLYTTPNCHQCRPTQRKLNDHALPYRLISLENEPTIATHLKAHGLLQAPIVEVPGEETQIWSGYRPDLIDRLAARQAHHEQ